MPDIISPKQLAFCHEYIKDRNATKAAERAGYSIKSAQVQGCQLLKHPKVAARIASLTRPIEKKSTLTAERVIQELSNIAFFDPASMYDESGKLLNVKDMPEETRRAIAGVEQMTKPGEKGELTKLRISSKLGSLELAAKILQLVKQEQTQHQAVQIVISAPAAPVVERVDNAKLLPEWD